MASNKPKWQKKEYKDIKDFNGRETKASGRTWADKGDSRTKDWLVESKYTSKKSYSISLKTWDQLYGQALLSFRKPLLSIQIQDETEVVVLDKEDFLELMREKEKTS